MRILMVCLGNICRSPLAHGVLRQKAKENGIEIEIDSCGTSNYHIGDPPDDRTVENALTHGVDLTDLRARQFTVADFDDFDAIYVMDQSNYRNVLALSRNEKDSDKVKMLLNEINPNSNQAVPDPYFGGEKGFENVYQLVNDACDKIIENLKRNQL